MLLLSGGRVLDAADASRDEAGEDDDDSTGVCIQAKNALSSCSKTEGAVLRGVSLTPVRSAP
jgi:hypothetical protein